MRDPGVFMALDPYNITNTPAGPHIFRLSNLALTLRSIVTYDIIRNDISSNITHINTG